MENKTITTKQAANSDLGAVSSSTWGDLWKEFILDCEKSNKKLIDITDFFFWLDMGFKVPDRL